RVLAARVPSVCARADPRLLSALRVRPSSGASLPRRRRPMPEITHVSSLAGAPLLDSAGERLGRVEDVVVRLDGQGLPPVLGLKARIGGRESFVPIADLAQLGPETVRTSTTKLNLAQFGRRHN